MLFHKSFHKFFSEKKVIFHELFWNRIRTWIRKGWNRKEPEPILKINRVNGRSSLHHALGLQNDDCSFLDMHDLLFRNQIPFPS